MTTSESIQWPAQHLPAEAAVFASGRLLIPATAEVIWPWLLRAELWPTWFPRARDVHFLSHTGPDLRNRSRFRWDAGGRRITSKVLEFVPYKRLAWDCHGLGLDGYHVWLLTPQPDGGTLVSSEETQSGWRVRLGRSLAPHGTEKFHAQWLEALSRQALSGLPPAAPLLAHGLLPTAE